MKCKHHNCPKGAKQAGYCYAHYERQRGKAKTPMDAPAPGTPAYQRLKDTGAALRDRKQGATGLIARLKPGKKFGRLTICYFDRKDRWGRKLFSVRCDCGREKTVLGSAILTGNTQSCGCLRTDSLKALRLPFDQAVAARVFRTYEFSARKRGIPFALTLPQLRKLIDSPCHYCGATGSNEAVTKSHSGYRYNGIDRKDSDKGYTARNTVPSCRHCNLAKRKLPYKVFVAWLLRAAEHLTHPRPHQVIT